MEKGGREKEREREDRKAENEKNPINLIRSKEKDPINSSPDLLTITQPQLGIPNQARNGNDSPEPLPAVRGRPDEGRGEDQPGKTDFRAAAPCVDTSPLRLKRQIMENGRDPPDSARHLEPNVTPAGTVPYQPDSGWVMQPKTGWGASV